MTRDLAPSANLCGLRIGDFVFVCVSKADNKTSFPCTGSAHKVEFGYVECSCACHNGPPPQFSARVAP